MSGFSYGLAQSLFLGRSASSLGGLVPNGQGAPLTNGCSVGSQNRMTANLGGTSGVARVFQVACQSTVRVVYPGLWNDTVGLVSESPLTANYQCRAVAAFYRGGLAGTLVGVYNLTFSGGTAIGTLTAGMPFLVSDPLSLPYAPDPGDLLLVYSMGVPASGGQLPCQNVVCVGTAGEGFSFAASAAFDGANDFAKTSNYSSLGTTDGNTPTLVFAPCGVIGQPRLSTVQTIAALGDSTMWGTYDSLDDVERYGVVRETFARKACVWNLGSPGEKIPTATQMRFRLGLIGGCDRILLKYSINDILGGATSAAAITKLTALEGVAASLSIPYHHCTDTPYNLSSTDAFRTTTNQSQTDATKEGYRTAINDWKRTRAYPCWDWADVAETSRNSGILKISNSVVATFTVLADGSNANNVCRYVAGSGTADNGWRQYAMRFTSATNGANVGPVRQCQGRNKYGYVYSFVAFPAVISTGDVCEIFNSPVVEPTSSCNGGSAVQVHPAPWLTKQIALTAPVPFSF